MEKRKDLMAKWRKRDRAIQEFKQKDIFTMENEKGGKSVIEN